VCYNSVSSSKTYFFFSLGKVTHNIASDIFSLNTFSLYATALRNATAAHTSSHVCKHYTSKCSPLLCPNTKPVRIDADQLYCTFRFLLYTLILSQRKFFETSVDV